MKPFLVWMTQSSARILVVMLLAVLGYFVMDAYQAGRDLGRVCSLLGSHDATGADITAERRSIDAICLGQETDDEP